MTILDDAVFAALGATAELRDEQEPCPSCETPMRVLVLTCDGWWGVRVIPHCRSYKQPCNGDAITLRKGRIR